MKRETLGKLHALEDALHRDEFGCGEPGYEGTTASEVNARLQELIRLLIADEEGDDE